MGRFEVEYVRATSCFKVVLIGAAPADLLIQIRNEIQSQAEHLDEFSIYVDLRRADLSAFSEVDIGQFQASAFRARAKRFAVLALDDLQYGVARQFFGHADSSQAYELLISKDESSVKEFVDPDNKL